MRQAQKIIKYLSISFAVFLIFSIISLLLGGFGVIFDALNLTNTYGNDKVQIDEEIDGILKNGEVISTLDIKINTTNLEINYGDKFDIETNNPKLEYENDNGHVKLVDNLKSKVFINDKERLKLVITIPKDTTLESVNINSGASSINVSNLLANNLVLKLGAGSLEIENISVNNRLKLEGGVGKITINKGKIMNLDLDLGVGKTVITADLDGNSKINTGVGKLDFNLLGSSEKYYFDIEKGLGEISFNNETIKNNITLGNGSSKIKISGGIGSINIKTNNNNNAV